MGFLGKLVGEVVIGATMTVVTTCICHMGVTALVNHMAGRHLLTPPSANDELVTITVTREDAE